MDPRVRRRRRPAPGRLGRRRHRRARPFDLAHRDARLSAGRTPHPGAQLRFTDLDGNRLTALATNTPGGQLADLERRHRRRARCEDRIRAAKQTGLRNFPLFDFDQNKIWLAIVMLANQLTAWLQLLALAGTQAAGGSRNACGYSCFRSPDESPGDPATSTCVCRSTHPWTHLITTALRQLNPAPT